MINFGQKRLYQDTYTSGVNNWTNPGVTEVDIILVGGGGGGGGGDTYYDAGASGGGSGLVVKRKMLVTGNLTVTIGAGGAGGDYDNDGSDGGNSTITDGVTTITAYGGKGGICNAEHNDYLPGGAGMSMGQHALHYDEDGVSGCGGSNEYGIGGISAFRHSGYPEDEQGKSGYGYGAGGSGGHNNDGGDGTGGLCIISYYL